MATIGLFISVDNVKETTGISEGVGGKKLQSTIVDVQRRFIEPILGTDLFAKINTLVVSKTLDDAANAVYKTLVNDWLAPALAYYVYGELIVENSIRLEKGGTFVNNSTSASTASSSERNRLINEQRSKADWYADRMISFICDNETSYPEYSTNSGSDIYPYRPSPFQNFVLDDTNNYKAELRKLGIIGN